VRSGKRHHGPSITGHERQPEQDEDSPRGISPVGGVDVGGWVGSDTDTCGVTLGSGDGGGIIDAGLLQNKNPHLQDVPVNEIMSLGAAGLLVDLTP